MSTSDTKNELGITDEAVVRAANRLQAAASSHLPCEPVRDLIGRDDVQAAYAVQSRHTQRRTAAGAMIAGRKIGLTSKAVQAQLGVDRPDFGVLFDDMEYTDGDTVAADAVLQPRVEAEIAFVLKADLVDDDLDYRQVSDAIDYACPAIEICGSRIAGWDISFGDTVADNASAGAFVLGPSRLSIDQFEPGRATMVMTIDGEVVSEGTGAACLGDPLLAVQWLARTVRELGAPLRKGEVILSGALGPMRPIAAGSTVHATVAPIGSVQFTLGKES